MSKFLTIECVGENLSKWKSNGCSISPTRIKSLVDLNEYLLVLHLMYFLLTRVENSL
jgi:hypothetical protein